MAGLSIGSDLSVGNGISAGDGLSAGSGLSFEGFGTVGPPGANGITLEAAATDFLMLEDGTSFLLQEA